VSRTARAEGLVGLQPEGALRLWTDLRRWPTFVEGFARAIEVSPDWPAEGSKIVWESIPSGRGRVTEKVVARANDRFATDVYEEALTGRQTLTAMEEAEGTRIELALDYELASRGPLRALADLLFIRRALRDAMGRTLRRFAVEAEEEAALR
jgi:Polyketide cyclase / dehydrase and lipid transport